MSWRSTGSLARRQKRSDTGTKGSPTCGEMRSCSGDLWALTELAWSEPGDALRMSPAAGDHGDKIGTGRKLTEVQLSDRPRMTHDGVLPDDTASGIRHLQGSATGNSCREPDSVNARACIDDQRPCILRSLIRDPRGATRLDTNAERRRCGHFIVVVLHQHIVRVTQRSHRLRRAYVVARSRRLRADGAPSILRLPRSSGRQGKRIGYSVASALRSTIADHPTGSTYFVVSTPPFPEFVDR